MDIRQPRPSPCDPPDHPVDPDLALLEAYLDGELTSAELQALQQRLHADAELSDALGRLSSEYTVRQAVFTSLEGTNAESEQMARAVARSVRQATFWERVRHYVRAGAVAAACVICFAAGWAGRGSAAIASGPVGAGSGRPDLGLATRSAPAAERPLLYQVALTDEQGNITAVEKFDSLDEARNFAADVVKWQAQQADPAQGEQPVLMRSGL